MGVNPVPDNILSRRGGSRTARPPNPTVIPTHHSVVPAQIPPPQTRGREPIPTTHISCRAERSRGISLPFPSLSSRMRGPIPPYPLFPRRPRLQNTGVGNPSPLPTSHAERSRGISLPFPSLFPRRPSLSVVPAQSPPPKHGGGNPSTSSHVVLAHAGTHPSFPRCHYYENRPFRGYKSLPP